MHSRVNYQVSIREDENRELLNAVWTTNIHYNSYVFIYVCVVSVCSQGFNACCATVFRNHHFIIRKQEEQPLHDNRGPGGCRGCQAVSFRHLLPLFPTCNSSQFMAAVFNSYSSKQSNGYATRKARAWVFSITLTSCEEVRNQRVEINALRCFEMMRVSGLISVPDCHRRINTLIKTSYSRPLGQRVLEVPLPDPRKCS